MQKAVQLVAGLAAALACCAAAAQTPQNQADREAEDVLAAVVRIKMNAIAGARSSATLGASREGTGVVIDERGYIVTIGYIVIEADSIEITTQDDRTFAATLVGYDHASGLALLRSGAPLGIKPMPMGQAADVAQREPVMVLPAGGRDAASLAYVVAKRKFAASWEYLLDTAIFTSPPAMQWAGAALVSREGKLVGVGSLLVREAGDGSQSPGNMFVPIDLLKPILADLIEKGRRSGPARPWLGLATEELHGHLLVTRVSPDGPADRAGIRNGDIVVGVGKDPVKTHEDLYMKVWGLGAAGVDVPLKVLQGVDMRELKVRSIDRFQYFREKPAY
ncbi:MAG TPA: S1C family serine protease [Burkholderiales bacterium]|nr:S1C family serine protease [Burkholderiales bacterium]